MTVTNYNQIMNLLRFDSDDDFYHLQILKRKKEHPDLGSNSYCVKTYFIKSKSDLMKNFPEIVCLCKFHNARAYINLNRRSFEKAAMHTLKKVTDVIMNKDFKSARKAYTSVCGNVSSEERKLWVVDVDYENTSIVDTVSQIIDLCKPTTPIPSSKEVARIRTKNGWHLITTAFNVQEFKERIPSSMLVDIHKDNPTILYIP